MPKRIRMRRDRPWRAENPQAVRVDRSTPWGNPYRVGDEGVPDLATAVALFEHRLAAHPEERERIRRALAGRDLACWCPLDGPCHADVLLRVANAID